MSPVLAKALESRPCGGLATRVGGAAVVLRASGALWVEEARALVVADLHLEKGSAYAVRGQLLPPYDTRETLRRLEAEVAVTAPRLLVFLGDTFHDRRSEGRLAPDDADRLRALAAGRTLVWVVGNHDADGPQALPGEVAAEFDLHGLKLRHEPRPGAQPGELAGHLHPCAKVAAAGGVVRRRCFVTDGERAVLPAFGAYAGGLNIRDPAFSGMFVRTPIAAALGAGRVHPVGWKSLRAD
ncbi:MAG: ligase-associated DNA damage response endonuclease PdeM [Phenylobacterium sp.]|jgi:DNA ligase-associated metallophosphoesterase|uniref:ligase-associated DNA damage response endonuclease PdeM n=1 Tax=Phenylobacterium sp. TaxID=1871053 RepID=UPI002A35A205|nr:ligase-associated DNA damage response endonuclease PdeM [Phenylobacterium sp.]MDX9997526.1 ligase-associated DNA damage response endonuclease PdeM [Phenylobacterium sp.]